jgi:type II secretory ATPase GspE/PulE/Tfp pilus assembly ATPase PilB-like protein
MFRRKKKASDTAETSFEVDPRESLPAVEFKPPAENSQQQQGVLISCRAIPQYGSAVMLVAHALNSRADQILMDFTAQGAAVRFRVDGLWEKMPPMDRETGDGVLVVLKRLLLLNPTDRRSQQKGKLPVKFKTIDWVFHFASQGVPNGERVLIHVLPKKPVLNTLSDLGMREKIQEKYKQLINGPASLFIFSGPAGHGLPTTWRVGLEAADRFVRDFHCIHDVAAGEPEIINIANHTFNASAGETPMTVLKSLLLKQPDALILPDFQSPEIVELLCDEVQEEQRYLITRVVADSAVEALLRLLVTYRASAKKLLEITCGVINQRLVRRLCTDCREAYPPSPQLMQKLGIPPGRVQTLYKAYIPPPPEQRVDANGKPIEIPICKRCGGRGYYGRAAIFELLVLDDQIRQAILSNPTLEAVQPVACKQGFLKIQEEGVLAVCTGMTSLQELQRVLSK